MSDNAASINNFKLIEFFKADEDASTVTICAGVLHSQIEVSVVFFTLPITRVNPPDDQWRGKIEFCSFGRKFRYGLNRRNKSFNNAINLDIYLAKDNSVNVKLSYNPKMDKIIIQISGAKNPDEDGAIAFQLVLEHIVHIQNVIDQFRADPQTLLNIVSFICQSAKLDAEVQQYLYQNYKKEWIDIILSPMYDLTWPHYLYYLKILCTFPVVIQGEFNETKIAPTMVNYNHKILHWTNINLDMIAMGMLKLKSQGAYDNFYVSYDNTMISEINIQHILDDRTDFTRRKTQVVIFKIKNTGTISQTAGYRDRENNKEIITQLATFINHVLTNIYYGIN